MDSFGRAVRRSTAQLKALDLSTDVDRTTARKKLDTLTEPMYYVLLSLVEERHGYGVMQYASQLTGGRVAIGAGTLYALLDRFERDGLIIRTRLEDNRKYYRLTADGRKVLEEEFDRLRRQVADGECVLKGRRMP